MKIGCGDRQGSVATSGMTPMPHNLSRNLMARDVHTRQSHPIKSEWISILSRSSAHRIAEKKVHLRNNDLNLVDTTPHLPTKHTKHTTPSGC